MLRDNAEQRTWYEQLKEFDFSDVNQSVNDYISMNNRRPTPADIISGAKRYRSTRRAAADYHNERLVKCNQCNDTGWVNTVSPTGTWTAHPCTVCGRGREVCPGYFLTDEEREAALKEEEKQGLKPPRNVHVAPDDFRDWYLYGNKI